MISETLKKILLKLNSRPAWTCSKASIKMSFQRILERFSLFDGLIYLREKHNSVLLLADKDSINTILHECHDSVYSGHLSEDRTLEKVADTAW